MNALRPLRSVLLGILVLAVAGGHAVEIAPDTAPARQRPTARA